jgi:RNA polymerase sigma factor (sigma-70 family)
MSPIDPSRKFVAMTNEVISDLINLRDDADAIVDLIALSSIEIQAFADQCQDLTQQDRRLLSTLRLAVRKKEALQKSGLASSDVAFQRDTTVAIAVAHGVTALSAFSRGPTSNVEGTIADEWPRHTQAPISENPKRERQGSSRAHAANLYARYSEGLLAFFRASLPIAKDHAMDLLQQTFVELLQWQSNGPNRAILHPRAFLYTIANRRLCAYRDKQRRTPDDPQGTEPQLDAQAHRDDLEYLSALHDDQRAVLRAMRRMEDRDLQVMLYLRFWEGLTEEGVARVFSRTRSAVAHQLRRARAAVEAKLAELGEKEPEVAQTSTTLLERWWRQIEEQAHNLESDEDDMS